jgi:tetratricopeptide (TPR) repeat protein
MLVVRIEDLHWADSELVRLFDRLTFDAPLRMLVLATARPEFPAMPLIRPHVDRLILEVPPLDPDSARALALAAGPTPALVDRAEGHPLFILELVRTRETSPGGLPVTVQAAISARLDELAPSDRQLLQTAAVVGETFDARSVALLTERDPADIAGALGRLIHLRYVRAVDGKYRFDHALVHDTAYGRLPVATRMRLHAQYARDGLPADASEVLAHHWWEALRPPDADWVWGDDPDREAMRLTALEAHVAAGRALGDRLASDRMIETFGRALQLARSPVEEAHVEEAFGLAYQRIAKGDDAFRHRMRAIELYRDAGRTAPISLYADMLDVVAFNWGYFRDRAGFDNVLGLIDEAIAIARTSADRGLLRLLIQRAAVTSDASVLPEIESLLATAPDPTPYADALWRLAVVHFDATADLTKAGDAIGRAFELAARGAPFNEPEALVWRAEWNFHIGDLARSEADADRLLMLSNALSAHTRSHAIASKARVHWARGEWDRVHELGDELRALVRSNPEASWCLYGANLAAYAAIADLAGGRQLPQDFAELIDRLIPGAPSTRAGVMLVPLAMAGESVSEDDARRAYLPETPIWDRESMWDLTQTHFALANVVRERWEDVDRGLERLDAMAQRGARFAGALAAALREEVLARREGGTPSHAELRRLGYVGISELLRYRVAGRVKRRDTLSV